MPLLKLLNVLMGSVALVAFWRLANAQARAELARESSAPAASDSSLLGIGLILIPKMALIALLWRTGWGARVHERLHGLLMRCLGVHPTYGVFLRT